MAQSRSRKKQRGKDTKKGKASCQLRQPGRKNRDVVEDSGTTASESINVIRKGVEKRRAIRKGKTQADA